MNFQVDWASRGTDNVLKYLCPGFVVQIVFSSALLRGILSAVVAIHLHNRRALSSRRYGHSLYSLNKNIRCYPLLNYFQLVNPLVQPVCKSTNLFSRENPWLHPCNQCFLLDLVQ